MVTYSGLIEFEHEVSKSTPINDHAIALQAGDAVAASAILKRATGAQTMDDESITAFSELVAQQYNLYRLGLVDEHIFKPRGLSSTQFYSGQQQAFQPQLAAQLDHQASTFQLGVQLIVAGVDQDGAHIHGIDPPAGLYMEYEAIGFHAIGSGAIHALQSLIELKQAPTRSLVDSVTNVVISKRRAEVAPGVGHDSDIFVVRQSQVTRLEDDVVERVDAIYQASLERSRERDSEKLTDLATILDEGKVAP
ncbi:MAG: hypothetical protein WBA63_04915 [Thermomicrobiales bacterium]